MARNVTKEEEEEEKETFLLKTKFCPGKITKCNFLSWWGFKNKNKNNLPNKKPSLTFNTASHLCVNETSEAAKGESEVVKGS